MKKLISISINPTNTLILQKIFNELKLPILSSYYPYIQPPNIVNIGPFTLYFRSNLNYKDLCLIKLKYPIIKKVQIITEPNMFLSKIYYKTFFSKYFMKFKHRE